ncbi:hypothetical protein D3C80_1383670 [compost metagenome]
MRAGRAWSICAASAMRPTPCTTWPCVNSEPLPPRFSRIRPRTPGACRPPASSPRATAARASRWRYWTPALTSNIRISSTALWWRAPSSPRPPVCRMATVTVPIAAERPADRELRRIVATAWPTTRSCTSARSSLTTAVAAIPVFSPASTGPSPISARSSRCRWDRTSRPPPPPMRRSGSARSRPEPC